MMATHPISAVQRTSATDARVSGARVLRRQCACGQHSPGGTQCGGCATRAVTAPQIVHDVLGRPGEAIDAPTRAFMETRFGRDFSGVRVHAGGHAEAAARAVDARAFTVGQSIVFGPGAATAAPAQRLSLLAHELSHTIQQSGARGGTGPIEVGAADAPAEREADARASRALRADRAASLPLSPMHAPVLQRQQTNQGPPLVPLPHPFDRLDIKPITPGPIQPPNLHGVEQARDWLNQQRQDGGGDCRGMIGFTPGGGSFKGQCCQGWQSTTTCCKPEKFSFRENRCCHADEVVRDNGCVKKLDQGVQPDPTPPQPPPEDLPRLPKPDKPPLQDLPGSTLPPGQAYA